MISYKIETFEVTKDTKGQRTIQITGWAYSDEEEVVSLDLEASYTYRIMRIKRTDLTVGDKGESVPCAGFIINILPRDDVSEVTLRFRTSNDEKVETLSLNWKQKRKLRKKSKMSCATEWRTLQTASTNDVAYYIESMKYLTQNEAVKVEGWSFDATNKGIWTRNEIEKNRIERPDVQQAFLDRNLSKDVGFGILIDTRFEETIDLMIGEPSEENIFLHFAFGSEFDSLNLDCDNEEHLYDVRLAEKRKNSKPYSYEKNSWTDAIVCQSTLDIIVAVNQDRYIVNIEELAKNLDENINILVATNLQLEESKSFQSLYVETDKLEDIWAEAVRNSTAEYIMVLEQEDFIEVSALNYLLAEIKKDEGKVCLFADYDLVEKDEHIIKVERATKWNQIEHNDYLFVSTLLKTDYFCECSSFEDIVNKVRTLNRTQMIHIDKIFYHFMCTKDNWNDNGRESKSIAFYLPQYHITEENNKWWGEGFTEWMNVKRAIPMMKNHHQPRIPGQLGYYDLVEEEDAQKKQIELAKEYGIYGFCLYYYWFEGKRLLKKPFDSFVNDKSLDLPFCICWANESWTKRWDGLESQVLMQQVHNEETDIMFIQEIAPILKDERYIKYDGKPLLLIYRLGLFPNPKKTIEKWKQYCIEHGVGDICVAAVQSFDMIDHRDYGADLSIEFPPHKVNGIDGLRIPNEDLVLDEKFEGAVFDYKYLVEQLSTISARDYGMLPGAMMEWDNTARRMYTSNFFTNFTPELFKKWMIKDHHYTKLYNKEPYIFINAWNEWAEGTCLEPDDKYGTTFLEIVDEVRQYK